MKIKPAIPLVALLLLLAPASASAMDCMLPSLEYSVQEADVVFKGHVLAIERHIDGAVENYGSGTHLERAIVEVDHPLRGALSAGQKITVIKRIYMPSSPEQKDWVATAKDRQEGLFLLQKASGKELKMSKDKTPVFNSNLCDPLYWDASGENLAIIEKAIESK